MNPALFLDLVYTVSFSVLLIAGGAAALWLLPWSDADRAGTSRALGAVARQAIEALRGPRSERVALPATSP